MVAKRSYTPERGDIVWLQFGPTHGHEQAGRRPGVVLSPKLYNERSGLALVCPITSQVKEYPFEIPIKARGVEGVVLADQIRSIDWQARTIRKAGKASASAITALQDCASRLIVE